MKELAFKQPTIAEVKLYMLKFVNSLSDKYPALLELDLDELAKNFVYAKEEDNWIAGDTDEYLKDWRMAAKREVIRNFDYIPFTEALDIKLTEEQELEIEDEMFIRCPHRHRQGDGPRHVGDRRDEERAIPDRRHRDPLHGQQSAPHQQDRGTHEGEQARRHLRHPR